MKIASRYFAFITLFIFSIIACDKDFASLDSDIINDENALSFNTGIELYRDNIIAYTKKLNPVQTNNLPVNLLGVYNDPVYGVSTYSFVTQLRPTQFDPDFGDNVELDSVVLTIPYFSRQNGFDEDGVPLYETDSLIGENPVKLSIYESEFFLRDFDPNQNFDDSQKYFSDQSLSGGEVIVNSNLEGTEILLEDMVNNPLNSFTPSAEAIELKDTEGNSTGFQAPSLRIKLDKDFWQEKIFNKEGGPELSNSNNFNSYFRGLYFKAEPINGIGNLMALDFSSTSANIIMYYTKDPISEDAERDEVTYTLRFQGVEANFSEFNSSLNFEDGNMTEGDQNLYLKGGEGSLALIKLFDGEDVDDNPTTNSFEEFKNDFVETDQDGNFKERKRLINEANLVFTIDDNLIDPEAENTRLYLYDANNNRPLLDYVGEIQNTFDPFNSITEHLGQMELVSDQSGQSFYRYKFNITQHVINLLTRDSTNISLGLAVSANVNLEANLLSQRCVLDEDDFNIPVSSVLSPRGTVLAGNANTDEDKRVFLEIFYTEPKNE